MRKLLYGIIAATLLGGALPLEAASSGAQFLKIGSGARPEAMGGAFAGLSDDVDAIGWNPAGLTQLRGLEQSFMHTSWLDGIAIEYGAVAKPLGNNGAIGAALEYVNMGDIPRYNRNGYDTGSYNAYDLMGSLSYAYRLKENWSLGASLKMLQEKIESEQAQCYAADLGTLYSFTNLRLGFAVRNVGGGLTFRETVAPLPLTMLFGASYRLGENALAVADFNMPSDTEASVRLGGEYVYARMDRLKLALRGGYRTGNTGLDGLAGVSMGFGVRYDDWNVDYALAPYGDLGMTHRLSIKIKFTTVAAAAPAPAESVAEEPASLPGVPKIEAKKYEIVIRKGKTRERLKPEDMYRDALKWYTDRAAKEKLDRAERLLLLERIEKKFLPLGVDVSEARTMIEKVKNEE